MALIILAQMIHHPDLLTQKYTLLSLAHLTDSKDEKILKEITSYGFVPKIVKLLSNEDKDISSYSLRIIGNLTWGESDITEVKLPQKFSNTNNVNRYL